MKNFSLIALVAFVFGAIGGIGVVLTHNTHAPELGAAANVTTIGNPWVFSNTITFSVAPTFSAETLNINGVGMHYARETLSTGTTTPGSLQCPAATSTIVRLAANITTSTTTASSLVFTKGAAMQATTTALSGLLAIAANAQISAIASTTDAYASGFQNLVCAPNNWVQATLIGGSGTVSPVGTFTAIFQEID